MCHADHAETLFKKVMYYHTQNFDSITQRFTCCGGIRDTKGCQMRSQRKPGELTQAEASLQEAISGLSDMQLQNNGM